VLTVYDTVQNVGLVSSGGASTTRYWLSLDKPKSSGDKLLVGSRLVSSVGPGGLNSGQVQATVPTSTTPGAYYLIACADAGTAVTELVETNNCKASDTPDVIVSVP
jgi:hypothetical protein